MNPSPPDANDSSTAIGSDGRMLEVLFTLTVFLSAFLLFQVQPLIGKVLLPWFGGTPSVWSAAMLVFQWLLFAGYAYAHLTTRWLSATRQTALHVAILLTGAILLPILPGDEWKPAGAEHPWLSVVGILLACVGVPFFLLSTSGPLLQAWYARTFDGRSPYRLYAISNAGSLLALLSYPFLIEPRLLIVHQSWIWSGLFVAFAVLTGTTALVTLRRRSTGAIASLATDGLAVVPTRPPFRTVATWFVLGAIPSIMMLAATNQVCVDVAPTPFLWLVPLSLYLLSFILCFESTRWYSRTGYSIAFAISAVLMTGVLAAGEDLPILPQVAIYFGGTFFCAMVCHGELSRLKPDPRHLTLFYLVLSIAGAVGGTFVSLIAPLIFDAYHEIHLAILGTLAVLLFLFYSPQRTGAVSDRTILGRRLLAATTLLSLAGLGYGVFHERQNVVFATRNFYGVMRVVDEHQSRTLNHGRIVHGRQFLDEDQRRVPTTYYGERSGIGLAMRQRPPNRASRIGVVGLGAGTLAAYGRPEDTFRFYELDPDVLRVAREQFTFLQDCPAQFDIVLGDARLALEAERDRAAPQAFDILAIDAFSGDAIPVHLLTREAIALYLQHLHPEGILALHVSNRHFDLLPVVADLAKTESLVSRIVATKGSLKYETDSVWVLLSRLAPPLDSVALRSLPTLDAVPPVSWTDDYCSLASVLKRQDFRLVLQGSHSQDQMRQGIEALEKNDLVAAEAVLRKAAADDPKNAGIWLHLGNTYRRGGRVPQAIEAFREALAIDESYSEAHNNLGVLLSATDPRTAERHVRQAIALDPRNAEAHSSLGNMLVRRGKLPEAIAQYEAALAIKPSLAVAQKNLSVVQDMLREQPQSQ